MISVNFESMGIFNLFLAQKYLRNFWIVQDIFTTKQIFNNFHSKLTWNLF